MGKKAAFKVEFEMPPDASMYDALAYVSDAVGDMYGCYQSDEPFHYFNPASLKVTIIKKKRRMKRKVMK